MGNTTSTDFRVETAQWANEDISLTSSSAMIDAGDSSSAYNDADGSRNDIGALGGANSDWDDGVPGID